MAVARPFVPPVQKQKTYPAEPEDDCYEDGVYYRDSDGKPMAETPKHFWQMVYCIHALTAHYADDPLVYVMGNNSAVVSPDCYVVFGIDKRDRPVYKVWHEEGRTPNVVFEITSKKTRREDFKTKMEMYEQKLNVEEYFLFDPEGKFLRPRLQGYRLVNGKYERLLLINDRLHSEQLGLDLIIEGELMRMYDPVTEENLLTNSETIDVARQEAQRAEEERLRAEQEAQRADKALNLAEQAIYQAEQETQRANMAEAELARLRAEIEASRRAE